MRESASDMAPAGSQIRQSTPFRAENDRWPVGAVEAGDQSVRNIGGVPLSARLISSMQECRKRAASRNQARRPPTLAPWHDPDFNVPSRSRTCRPDFRSRPSGACGSVQSTTRSPSKSSSNKPSIESCIGATNSCPDARRSNAESTPVHSTPTTRSCTTPREWVVSRRKRKAPLG